MPRILEDFPARSVLDLARKLNEDRGFSPSIFLERLNSGDAQLVTAIASEREAHVTDADGCARIIKRLRCERERTAIQREIDRLQELGGATDEDRLNALLARKLDLLHRIEGLI
jgi:hypothetical protein